MLQRAIRATASKGMFTEAQRLLLKLLEIAPEDANYSRTKWRFAAELVKTAVIQQKGGFATGIGRLAGSKIEPAHLTSPELAGKARAHGGRTPPESKAPAPPYTSESSQ